MITYRQSKVKLCLVTIIGLVLGVSSSPIPKTTYDQSQQGELNVRADLENILILFIPSGGIRLLDNPQMGSILQIFSNSRKNPPVDTAASPVVTSGISDSPYKVEIAQSAIEKLQSDVESFNTVIPISKNFNAEKKEISSQSPLVNIDANNRPQIILHLADKQLGEDTKIEDQTSVEIPVTFNETTVNEKVTNEEGTVVNITSSPVQDVTTIESIVTSQPVVPQKSLSKEEVKGVVKPTTDKPQVKTQQRVVIQEPQKQIKNNHSQTSRQASRPSFDIPTPSKTQPQKNDEREKLLRRLQTGLVHCSPGEKMTQTGQCVPIEPSNERQSRDDEQLKLLQFGILPLGETK